MATTKTNPSQGKEDTLEDADGDTKVQVEETSDDDKIRFDTSGTERMIIDSTGVGIATSSPAYNLHVASSASSVLLIDGASNTDAILRFGQAGTLKSYIKQGSGGNLVITNETADKDIILSCKDSSTEREGLRINGDVAEVVINEGSESLVDFRVESDNNTHMLFVDGSADFVGINTSTPGSGLHIAHSISLPTGGSPKTGAYSLTATDFCIVADCNSSAFTITLPSATDAMAGRIYTIKRMDSGNSGGANQLTISRNSKNIDNIAGDLALANLDAVTLQCIGASGGWIRIGQFLAPMP